MFDLKAGDVCKYVVNDVAWYMIIHSIFVDKDDDLTDPETLVCDVLRGFKVDNIENFVDLKETYYRDYRDINYIRFHGNVYFPLLSLYWLDVKEFKAFDDPSNSIEVIGHLSDDQLLFSRMVIRLNKNGNIWDIDELDTSEIGDTLNAYKDAQATAFNMYENFNNMDLNKKEREDYQDKIGKYEKEAKEKLKQIRVWFINSISDTVPMELPETSEEEYEIDVKDVRDFEPGGLYQYYTTEGIKYTFIWSNYSKGKTDDELKKIEDNGNDIIVGACDVALFNEEDMYTHSGLFSPYNNEEFIDTNTGGYFRFLGKYYAASGGIHNWVWYGFEKFGDILNEAKLKLITKIDPNQLETARLACKYNLHGSIIDIDEVDIDKVRPIISKINKSRNEIAKINAGIKLNSSKLVKHVLNKEFITEKGHEAMDVIEKKEELD